MTTFEVPTITTARLRLRAFRASDLDAYSAMQANPEVMRYMVTGRTAMPAEVWRTMLMSLGSWALHGYGMWACEKIEGDVFIGSVGIFEPLDRPSRRSPCLTDPFKARATRRKQRVPLATGSLSIIDPISMSWTTSNFASPTDKADVGSCTRPMAEEGHRERVPAANRLRPVWR